MSIKPLTGVRVTEVPRRDVRGTAGVAVALAGHLVAALGGAVTRVLPDGVDPLAGRPPLLTDGSSALERFLTSGKAMMTAVPASPGTLITDDPEVAQGWTAGSTVLVEATPTALAHADSELTVLAASGLLDIVGDPDAPPLPLPGHQTAYAAGIAAFNAFICAHFAQGAGQPISRSRVSVVDVALWLNWKHFLAAHLQLPNVGIGRAEEWRTYRCRDGYIAFVFQDKDLAMIAALTGERRFLEVRFATQPARRANFDEFCDMIARWVGEHTRDEIVARSRALRIPIGPVLKIDELLGDRQMLARDFIDLATGSTSYGMPRLPVLWTPSELCAQGAPRSEWRRQVLGQPAK